MPSKHFPLFLTLSYTSVDSHDKMSTPDSARIVLVYFLAAKCLFSDIYCQSPNALLLFMHIIELDVEAISVSVMWTIAIKALYGFGKAGGRQNPDPDIVAIVEGTQEQGLLHSTCTVHCNNKASMLNLSL